MWLRDVGRLHAKVFTRYILRARPDTFTGVVLRTESLRSRQTA